MPKLKWLLFPLTFIMVFLVTVVVSFPGKVIEDISLKLINQYLFATYTRQEPPKVTISSASSWRISGVSLGGVKISFPKTSLPKRDITIEQIRARVGLFSLLSSKKSFSGNMRFMGGKTSFSAQINPVGTVRYLETQIEEVDLSKGGVIAALFGVDILGKLDGDIFFSQPKEPQTAEGNLGINLAGAMIKGGNINLPGVPFASGINIPDVSLGKIEVFIDIDKGNIVSQKIVGEGGDLEFNVKLSGQVASTFGNSNISANGWFRLKDDVIQKDDMLKTLYDLVPQLKTARMHEGKVGFTLAGTISSPRFRLEEYRNEN